MMKMTMMTMALLLLSEKQDLTEMLTFTPPASAGGRGVEPA